MFELAYSLTQIDMISLRIALAAHGALTEPGCSKHNITFIR